MANNRYRTAGYHCPECEARAFTRNNYFTGKLLVERDFTDEQRYYREKMRMHHQRLHGAGVVCGLRVRSHEREDCRTRYLVLEPGSAIDCCGHDILVAEPETIDLETFPAIRELIESTEDDADHSLRVCIRYRECPTEEIPVLYDECGCDDTQCAPNRILETYAVEVQLDPTEQSAPAPRDCRHAPSRAECPSCDAADCIVLARITGYRPGRMLLEPSDTASGAAEDTARIDNDVDRILLPSAQDLSERLSGRDLAHITRISWSHADDSINNLIQLYLCSGLRVLFDKEVDPSTVHDQSVRVLIPREDEGGHTVHWCQMKGTIRAMHFSGNFPMGGNEVAGGEHAPSANGLWFFPIDLAGLSSASRVRVLINGDFIRDANGCGVDADHLPPWLPQRPTGDGVEGGLFESWFSAGIVKFSPSNLPGMESVFSPPVAKAIVAAEPTSIEELLRVPGVDPELIHRIRDHIVFDWENDK